MLVILTFIEKNNGIPKEFLEQLKTVCADKSATALNKPTEDIYLMVETMVKEIK